MVTLEKELAEEGNFEYLTEAEIIKRYGYLLTDAQRKLLKEIENHDNIR